MLNKIEIKFSILFVLLLLLELVTDSNSAFTNIHFFAKPMLLIALLAFFWSNSKHLDKQSRVFTILALGFSLLGDSLLMFVNDSTNFFISGLVAFLIAHLMYIIVFQKKRNPKMNPIPMVVILLLYAAGLFYLLQNGLGDMFIPVTIYMLVILTMSITAYLRKTKVNSTSYILVFIGAILFMISDSLLALNKFYTPLAYANISIMTTYAFAQLCIVLGLLKQR